jgi:hypothetical protein
VQYLQPAANPFEPYKMTSDDFSVWFYLEDNNDEADKVQNLSSIVQGVFYQTSATNFNGTETFYPAVNCHEVYDNLEGELTEE